MDHLAAREPRGSRTKLPRRASTHDPSRDDLSNLDAAYEEENPCCSPSSAIDSKMWRRPRSDGFGATRRGNARAAVDAGPDEEAVRDRPDRGRATAGVRPARSRPWPGLSLSVSDAYSASVQARFFERVGGRRPHLGPLRSPPRRIAPEALLAAPNSIQREASVRSLVTSLQSLPFVGKRAFPRRMVPACTITGRGNLWDYPDTWWISRVDNSTSRYHVRHGR